MSVSAIPLEDSSGGTVDPLQVAGFGLPVRSFALRYQPQVGKHSVDHSLCVFLDASRRLVQRTECFDVPVIDVRDCTNADSVDAGRVLRAMRISRGR